MIQKNSFRDPHGKVFSHNGIVYRAVYHRYRDTYDALVGAGVFDTLISQQLLIPHQEVDPAQIGLAGYESSYKILQPVQLAFISQPQEWSFSMLQAAALTTLAVQRVALAHGFTLKDASAHNIQFYQGKAVLIDTLSLEKHEIGQAWPAYGQFCRHFIAPLCLSAFTDARLQQLFAIFPDGVPLDLATKLLPLRAKLRGRILWHLVFHARAERSAARKQLARDRMGRSAPERSPSTNRNFTVAFLQQLNESLAALVHQLRYRPTTDWSQYYQTEVGEAYLQNKKAIVADFLDKIAPSYVWDLGTNAGDFAKLAALRGIRTCAFDADHDSIEKLSRELAQAPAAPWAAHLQGYVIDLVNPSPDSGWGNAERQAWLARPRPDTVLALALIHHLRISANVPLAEIIGFLVELAPQIIVEFVPKSDEKVQRLLQHKTDYYDDYTPENFECLFAARCQLINKQTVHPTQRVVYVFARK